MTPNEILTLCDDGEMLDGLVKRFEERAKKNPSFEYVYQQVRQAKNALDRRMNAAANAMDRELKLTAEGK